MYYKVPPITVSRWDCVFNTSSTVFIAHDITGEVLLDLNHDVLKEMGITSTGRRLKLLKSIGQLSHA